MGHRAVISGQIGLRLSSAKKYRIFWYSAVCEEWTFVCAHSLDIRYRTASRMASGFAVSISPAAVLQRDSVRRYSLFRRWNLLMSQSIGQDYLARRLFDSETWNPVRLRAWM